MFDAEESDRLIALMWVVDPDFLTFDVHQISDIFIGFHSTFFSREHLLAATAGMPNRNRGAAATGLYKSLDLYSSSGMLLLFSQ